MTLYYLGRYKDAGEQFRRDLFVNDTDTEEALWHMACSVHTDGWDVAQRNFVFVAREQRSIMFVIAKLFAGQLTPEQVIPLTPLPDGLRAIRHACLC